MISQVAFKSVFLQTTSLNAKLYHFILIISDMTCDVSRPQTRLAIPSMFRRKEL